jgi:hypothetical protein
MTEAEKVLVDGWLTISGWLSALILSGVTLCALVTVLRLSGKDVIKVKDIDVPLGKFWIVALSYTLGHSFMAWSFLRANERVLALSLQDRTLAWDRLTVGNNLLFDGMSPRPFLREYIVAGVPIRSRPIRRRARTALLWIVSPAPTSPIDGARSNTRTSKPARRKAIPAVRPPIPPPAIRTGLVMAVVYLSARTHAP